MADIPSSYISAVKEAKSALVPYASFGPILVDAGKATFEEQIGYSIVHITKDGKPSTDLKTTAFVAMPHVLARGNDKAIAGTMKQAGFTKEGLCKGRNDLDARKAEAARLAGKLWSMFGTPAAPKAKVVKAKAPAQVAEAAPVEAIAE